MDSETVPCPGCSAPMELDQEICGSCRRPRDEREIQAGYDLIHERDALQRRRPRKIAAAVLAALAAALIFRSRAVFLGLLAGWRSDVERDYETVRDSGPVPPKTAAGAALVAMLNTPPPGPPTTPRPVRSDPPPRPPAPPPPAAPAPAARSEPPPAPKPPPRKALPAPEPPAAGSYQRVVYGLIFDLKTAAPVAHAIVRFHPEGDPNGTEAQSDEDGHYRIYLDRSFIDAGVVATVSADGYQKGQLEDAGPSYLERSEEARRRALAELGPGDLDDVPVRYAPSARAIPLDLVLVPDAAPPGGAK